MKDYFKKTKMMEEARVQGKKNSPVIETLIFLAVFYVGNFAQSIVLFPAVLFYMYSDAEIINILSSEPPDLGALSERALQLSSSMPAWIFILSLFLTAFTVISVIVYCRCIEKRSLASIGLRKGKVFSEYVVGFVFGGVMMAAVAFCEVAAGNVKFEGLGNISAIVLLLCFIAYLIQGMAEEILIRGYFMTAIGKNASPVYALLCSSFLFAIMHLSNEGISFTGLINLFLFGVVAGVYVMKRGNIWGIAAFHSAWNFVQGTVFGFSVSGNVKTPSVFKLTSVEGFETLNGGAFGPEGGLWVTLILFVALGIVFIIKQNKNEIAEIEDNEENN